MGAYGLSGRALRLATIVALLLVVAACSQSDSRPQEPGEAGGRQPSATVTPFAGTGIAPPIPADTAFPGQPTLPGQPAPEEEPATPNTPEPGSTPGAFVPASAPPVVPTCLIESLGVLSTTSPAPSTDGSVTVLSIDGERDDWAGRDVIWTDDAGDADPGYADFTAGRAFLNDDAIYFALDFASGSPRPLQLQARIGAHGRSYFVNWEPASDNNPWVADSTDPNNWIDLGGSKYSSFAFGSVFEGRLDLRDIDGITEVSEFQVEAWDGVCCEWPDWQARDTWLSGAFPRVDESDPARLTAKVGGSSEAAVMLAAPDTRAIDFAFDKSAGSVAVSGGAGAVPGRAWVLVGNVEMNDYTSIQADVAGAFAAQVAGSPGTHVLVKQDTTGRYIHPEAERDQFGENVIAPGILHRLPLASAGDAVAFGSGARLCCEALSWVIEGTLSSAQAVPGQELRLQGTVTVQASSPSEPRRSRLTVDLGLLFDEYGRQIGRAGKFVSPFLTATGLPIERAVEDQPLGRINLGHVELERWRLVDGRWAADFDDFVYVPTSVRPGIYTMVAGGLWDLNDAGLEAADVRPLDIVLRDGQGRWASLATVVVGEEPAPRLSTILLADEPSEASRGIVAREDQGLFDVHLRTITRHDPVLPRLDYYGEPWAYRLEPYAVMLDAVDRALPNAPAIDLDLNDSALRIAVTRPDGTTDVLGPERIARYAVKSPRTLWGDTLGAGGGELRELPQLQGAGDTFAYEFPADGDYVIEVLGFVRGADGRRYDICGTYDVTIANVLDVEPALVPTTPFEVGDTLTPSLNVVPAMAVDVTYTVTHVAADGTVTGETFTGRSNAHGYFDGDAQGFAFVRDGEYRVDIEARGTDNSGALWVGRMRFGSVVATPDAPLVAHGRRGTDGLTEIPPPWVFISDLEYSEHSEAPHSHFPYFTGDVLWGQNHPGEGRFAGEAVVLHSSVQLLDESQPLLVRARALSDAYPYWDGPEDADTVQIGQMPLRLASERGLHPDQGDYAGARPDEIALWSYAYRSAERPGIRVREAITGDDIDGSYWRFGDAYGAQSGNGPQGDLPGDFKFMYGAAVVRDPAAGEGIYAIYGSGWIHAPDDDPLGSRIMPPYQGAAGGPDGGPLLTVHGNEVDILFVPMGVRPGAILETGDRFVMAGAIMPTLPSLVDYTITAPDGTTRRLGGRANAIGYFYDPADDFAVDQPGVWTVSLIVTHDGQTSAGPVEPPFPTGGPLAPDGTNFTFVVQDASTIALDLETDLSAYGPSDWWDWARIPTASFEAPLPAGFVVADARVVVTIPGVVLVDGAAEVRGGALRWALDSTALNAIAANFDILPNFADSVTVTFHATGTLNGEATQATGTITTHGARVPVAPAPAI